MSLVERINENTVTAAGSGPWNAYLSGPRSPCGQTGRVPRVPSPAQGGSRRRQDDRLALTNVSAPRAWAARCSRTTPCRAHARSLALPGPATGRGRGGGGERRRRGEGEDEDGEETVPTGGTRISKREDLPKGGLVAGTRL